MFLKKKKKGLNVSLKKRDNKLRGLTYYGIIAGILILAFVLLQIDARGYKVEVKVASLSEDIGNSVITEDKIKAKKILKKDVEKEMILWENRDKELVGKYPAMQIRKGTPIYKDMVSDEQVIRNEYLYELKPDEELLTFKYDNSMAGGRIARPGDKFRIRGSYTMEDGEREKLINQGVANSKGESTDVKDGEGNVIIKSANEQDRIVGNVRTRLIFDVATVVDMLNGDGDSIYEIWDDVLALPKSEQEEIMEDDSFKSSVEPESLLIVVKSNQVSRYVEFQAAKDANYTLTILSRDKDLLEDDIKMGGSLIEEE